MLASSRLRKLDSVLRQLSQIGTLREARNFQIRKFTSPPALSRPGAQSRLSPFSAQLWRSSSIRRMRGFRNYSNSAVKRTAQEHGSQSKSQSISARFKELSKKYGWAAVGVYFGLSALDFPFCFLAVRWLGTDRVAYAEHIIAQGFWKVIGLVGMDMRENKEPAPATGTAAGVRAGESVAEETGVQGSHHNASIWTQLLLAYGVHKSLIFFRVPLTAAVTPKVVKWLRARGWNIGKPKA